jgi:hypothetical protein
MRATLRLVKMSAGRLPFGVFMPMIAGTGPLVAAGRATADVSVSERPLDGRVTTTRSVPDVALAGV